MSSPFPDCHIYRMPQRSDEWFEARKGVLTASEVGPWILGSTKNKTVQKARENALCKLVSQIGGGWEPETFETEAMKRGSDLETLAVDSFAVELGAAVDPVGFCLSKHGAFGCSPDGLLFEQGVGLESKTPISSTHIKYRRAGVLPEDYKFQVKMSMAVTGAEWWWFQSWDPKFAPLRVLVERDKEVEDLLSALKEFSAELSAAVQGESEAWDAAFGKGAAHGE